MKNKCQRVEIIEKTLDSIKLKFLETGIIMPLSKDIFQAKVKQGFYKVIDN